MLRHYVSLIALAILAAHLPGCSRQPAGLSVNGTVIAANQPLAAGSIVLVPQPGTPGPSVGAKIATGNFVFTPEAQLCAGNYRIEIYAEDATAFDLDDPQQFAAQPARVLPRNSIAPAYNTQSQLVATLSAGGPQSLNFQVEYQR